jgi:hypothetical protein
MKYIIAMGNAFDGMRIVGPFEKANKVEAWAKQYGGCEYQIIPLCSPRSWESILKANQPSEIIALAHKKSPDKKAGNNGLA